MIGVVHRGVNNSLNLGVFGCHVPDTTAEDFGFFICGIVHYERVPYAVSQLARRQGFDKYLAERLGSVLSACSPHVTSVLKMRPELGSGNGVATNFPHVQCVAAYIVGFMGGVELRRILSAGDVTCLQR